MLTPSLQKIRTHINEMHIQERQLSSVKSYSALLTVLENMDKLEAKISKAFEESGLDAAAHVIVKPADPQCQICGRQIVLPTL